MAVHRFQTEDGKIHRVEAESRAEAEGELNKVLASGPKADPQAMQPKWGLPVIGDFARAGGQALDSLTRDAKSYYAAGSQPAKPRLVDLIPGVSPQDQALGKLTGSVLGLAAPLTEAFTRPVARGMSRAFGGTPETANQILNTSLMGLRPGAGRVPDIRGLPAPVARAGTPRPVAKGADYVRRVAQSAGITPDALTAAASPRPLMAAEVIGKPGQVALGALARRQGTTGDALNATIGERRLTRGPRLQKDFADAVGISPEAASGDIRSLVEAGRSKASPLYDEAYAVGPIDTPSLQLLRNRPSMKAAMSRAYRIAAEEGRDPTELGFMRVTRGDGSSSRNAAEIAWPNGPDGQFQVTGSKAVQDPQIADVDVQVENPTAQTWDYVKRGLDDILDGYRDKTTGRLHLDEQGRAILGTLKAMRGQLTDANPAYGRALSASGDYLSADQAFRDGGKFTFNSQMTEHQVAEHIGKLTDAEREAFKGGIANRLFDLSQNNRLDPKVLSTPRVQAKLTTALGPEAARALIAAADDEGAMLAFERRYGPAANSITAEMGDAMAQQDGGDVAGQMAGDFLGNLHRGPRSAISTAIASQLRNVGAMVRTPGLSVDARNEAGRMLMLPPEQLAMLLKAQAASRPRLPSGVGRIGSATEGVLPPPRK